MRIFIFFLVLPIILINSQTFDKKYDDYGTIKILKLKNALFPHPLRAAGHSYRDLNYPADIHYSDNSAAIFIPRGFQKSNKIDFVIHFHGWYNNIDSVMPQYKLIEQFSESNKNAILIIPQGPKNAPDSFGGRLEEKDAFKDFIYEIIDSLSKAKFLDNPEPGNIILSGHSGAYRVISFILMRGGLINNIKEVYLFDGQYGQTEKYVYWIDNYEGKFINIYTEDGGTKAETEILLDDLSGWEMEHLKINENQLTDQDLLNNRLIFIYTALGHNDVIHVNRNFYKFLKSSILKNKNEK